MAALALVAGAPVWSPPAYGAPATNGKIAFVSDRDGNQEIYAVNLDGTGLKNLTGNPSTDAEPAWSPDGTRLAFTSNRDGDNEIYVMAADGSGVTRLTTSPGNDSSPTWSPDGTKIAFTSSRDGNAEIYVMEVAKPTNLTRLTNNAFVDNEPAWSPDGTKIAFSNSRELESRIFVMDAATGGNVTRLASQSGEEHFPAWSPDGSKVAFTLVFSSPEIVVIPSSGGTETFLTSNAAADSWPSWSPDGTKIAFTTDRDGAGGTPTANTEIYIMNSDGSSQVRFTNAPSQELEPSWQRAVVVSPPTGSSGQVTASIPVAAPAVRSVNVSPTSVTYGNCQKVDGSAAPVLTFPNGTCSTPALVVTNSGTPANIHVQGSDAVPSDNGTHWNLCGSAPACSGPVGPSFTLPGTDQYAERTASSAVASGTVLSTSPQCDTAFNGGGCAATAGQASTETVGLMAPRSSTDSSPTFNTTLTWIAVP